MTQFGTTYVASLADLALMKAQAYQDNERSRDWTDLCFALQEMVQKRKSLAREIGDIEEVVERQGDDEMVHS